MRVVRKPFLGWRVPFYAGARALLVSHWEVDSNATAKLITSAVVAISQDKPVGRAEALRRAMRAKRPSPRAPDPRRAAARGAGPGRGE